MSHALYCKSCKQPLILVKVEEMETCKSCGAVWEVDYKSIVYSELIRFINEYRLSDSQCSEIWKVWRIPRLNTSRKVKFMFEKLGFDAKIAEGIISRSLSKMKKILGRGVEV